MISIVGTGGTVAGTGHYLRSMNPEIVIAIADPNGSGLYNKVRSEGHFHVLGLADGTNQVKHGVMYDRREAEGTRRRHQVDTVVEGMCVRVSSPIGTKLTRH